MNTWTMIARKITARRIVLAVALNATFAVGASGQAVQVVPNAMQGFSQSSDKPVEIKAQSFEMRDKEKVAVFTGNVRVVQGDTTIRCKSLIVSYRSDADGAGAKAAQPGPGGKSQINKLEAIGNVVVTQKDQTATGDRGIYDLAARTVTIVGNVVVSQGQNVMRGERMTVDLNTGISKLEAGKSKGVEMLIDLSKSNGAKPGAPAREVPRFDPLRPAQQN
jgi:lipopolysaccharide export system protein LptA